MSKSINPAHNAALKLFAAVENLVDLGLFKAHDDREMLRRIVSEVLVNYSKHEYGKGYADAIERVLIVSAECETLEELVQALRRGDF